MSTFRKPLSVLHETAGTYTNGVWSGGTRSVSSVQMSAQPLNSGQEMEALPEGRHLSESKKFYSSVKLKTTADGENIQPDIVVHGGYGYELVSAFDNQSGVINHYRYIGIKIFKISSTTDWTNGTLKRP